MYTAVNKERWPWRGKTDPIYNDGPFKIVQSNGWYYLLKDGYELGRRERIDNIPVKKWIDQIKQKDSKKIQTIKNKVKDLETDINFLENLWR